MEIVVRTHRGNRVPAVSDEEISEGYRDGRNPDSPEPSTNRSHSYRHGFANGRDDLNKRARATADFLRAAAIAAASADEEIFR